MSETVFHKGDKITLRTIEEEDLEFLRNGVNHPSVRVFMGNRRPQNLEEQQDFFEGVINSDDGSAHFLVYNKDDEKAGIISLNEKGDKAEKLGEVGLWLHPDHHGNGYGTEAAKIITRYGFRQLNYHKIYTRAYEGNKASQRIWEKLGYEKEGVHKDHTFTQGEYKDVVYYGTLEGDWK